MSDETLEPSSAQPAGVQPAGVHPAGVDAPTRDETASRQAPYGQIKLVLLIMFLAYLGQMILNPIIAPLARAMGLAEWHIGATISIAAVALALLSQFWGRRSLRVGAKKVLLTAMTLAFFALCGFAVVAWLGMQRLWVGVPLVLAVMLTRGLIYGGSIAAIAPTAQAYITSRVPGEKERLKYLGTAGAVQGLAAIIGAVLGGALAVGGLIVPLIVMPIMMLLGLVVLISKMEPYAAEQVVEEPPRISFLDPRVFPFLVVGQLLFLSFSAVQILIGFVIQDRFELNATTTASVTAAIMFIMSIVMIIIQGGVVPRISWDTRKLLRFGMSGMTLAMVLFIFADGYVLFVVASIVMGIGFGLALPGYTTGPTLDMSPSEQGGVAGVISSNSGWAYAIAPVLFTSLYGWMPVLPFLVGAVLLGFGAVFTMIHPLLRRSPAVVE
ncbi:MAG: MFS transporter [Actinomycetaceae bacterium]|nr:MFS transporter [Actinomycetaceae bacterium]